MVIGAERVSTVLNAASGTCPPLGNAVVEAIAVAPAALFDPVEFRLACEAVAELVGPLLTAVPVPPATAPEEPPDAAPVRTNRLRRSTGLFEKLGFTSSTTWYWFNCVNMVDTWRWP